MDVRNLETVIWDFNGTLVDDVSLAVRSINVELGRRGLPLVTVDSYRKVFGFPMADYYVRLAGFYTRGRNYERAMEAYRKALDYTPNMAQALDGIAWIERRLAEEGGQ